MREYEAPTFETVGTLRDITQKPGKGKGHGDWRNSG
jgi:hypothetical protein